MATAARVWVAGTGAGDAQQGGALAGSGDAQCASEWDQSGWPSLHTVIQRQGWFLSLAASTVRDKARETAGG